MTICCMSLLVALNVAALITPPQAPEGMVWIEGGEFKMGGVGPEIRHDELPLHRVALDGFFIKKTEVTNAQFKRFVDATGYKTIAERPVDWELIKTQVPPGTPQPPEDMLLPGSLVFHQPAEVRDTRDYSQWWVWTSGASWRHPEGPKSSIENRMDHPVVHVAWDDARAYAQWVGGDLPTESQWEYAARGGISDMPFIWGNEQVDSSRANIWEGVFPTRNDKGDGFVRTAPVGSYPANGYGLYDMAGNVWEWCLDQYRADEYTRRSMGLGEEEAVKNPQGPQETDDRRNLYAPVTRIQRGGSFLCHPSYCSSYRPSARMSTTPDSAMSHAGFRIVMTPEQSKAARNVQKVGD